jgi:hypothetical protein
MLLLWFSFCRLHRRRIMRLAVNPTYCCTPPFHPNHRCMTETRGTSKWEGKYLLCVRWASKRLFFFVADFTTVCEECRKELGRKRLSLKSRYCSGACWGPDEHNENPTEIRPVHLANACLRVLVYASLLYQLCPVYGRLWTALVTKLCGLRAVHFPCDAGPPHMALAAF